VVKIAFHAVHSRYVACVLGVFSSVFVSHHESMNAFFTDVFYTTRHD